MTRYTIELTLSLAAYVALLILSNQFLSYPALPNWAEIAVVLLPMVAALLIIWTILRRLQQIDELQRRIQFEALAIAFCGTALVTFSYGFLEALNYPKLSMFFVWPLMATLWVLGTIFGVLRYR